MAAFSEGQYVELYPTIPSARGGSVASGTRGIVKRFDPTREEDRVYLVAFLDNERITGEEAWLRATELLPA